MAQVHRLFQEAPKTWEEVINLFLLWKRAEGLSPATIGDYIRHIRQFLKRYPEAWPDNLRPSLIAYMGEDIAPATYNIRRAYLRAFFTWCRREGYIQNNPTDGLKKRKAPGRVVNIPPDILARLLELPDRGTFSGRRDLALIMLTLDSGIRPGEAFSLFVPDVNLPALELYVRAETAKTRTRRTLCISPATASAIADLIAARHPAWGDGIPLFCSSDGNPMTRHTWGDRLEIYSRKLGCRIRPYDLRHAFALCFLRGGGHVFALQRLMGHSDLTMTKRYLSLTQEDLREQHQRASPVLQLLPQRNRVRKIK
jgi:site-specific recombinase XerD